MSKYLLVLCLIFSLSHYIHVHGQVCAGGIDPIYTANNTTLDNGYSCEDVVLGDGVNSTSMKIQNKFADGEAVIIYDNLTVKAYTTLSIENNSLLVVVGTLTIEENAVISTKGTGYIYSHVGINGDGTIVFKNGNPSSAQPYTNGSISGVGGDNNVSGGNRETLSTDVPEIGAILDGITELPVELISFTASKQESNVKLEWSTASEENASHFEVYSSIDNKNWNLLGDVDASGNSATRIDYSFTDDQDYQSVAYYKLVQYDFDGQNETFGPLVVHFSDKENTFTTEVFPNPSTTGKASIQIGGINQGTTTTLQLLNREGRVVLFDTIENSNITSTIYELGNQVTLKPGLYVLKVNSGVSQSTKKIIIQ
ncbi:T9SS type A sorting domain-containing protein [Flammeovirga aprica]|uniref:T9SS type A sorting domain-containing protein n=1 Tax=Flammeovirga aprica JL-4 TaxID=694437 RepID=A0A7X9XC25_9BACT|nr:T9SS type A sorting domain-containing protein [Flammeovirga aprica]NME71351.1 T9SS type A sorting domain-containing protein [Flammeovirga aprica JL-4]